MKQIVLKVLFVLFGMFIGMETFAQSNSNKTINGHEYVDLGLSVKWATMNIGASSPSDYGYHYSWGETSTKSDYSNNCVTSDKSFIDIGGNPTYDVARKKWGSSWRLPSSSEFDELSSKCTWVLTNQGGHQGYKVTGPNGNSIFLPAAGFRNNTSLEFPEEAGCYWSSTPGGLDTVDIDDGAYMLRFGIYGPCVMGAVRSAGRSIRPVCD